MTPRAIDYGKYTHLLVTGMRILTPVKRDYKNAEGTSTQSLKSISLEIYNNLKITAEPTGVRNVKPS